MGGPRGGRSLEELDAAVTSFETTLSRIAAAVTSFETTLSRIAAWQREVDTLSSATVQLSESVEVVDQRLRDVRNAVLTAQEAERKAARAETSAAGATSTVKRLVENDLPTALKASRRSSRRLAMVAGVVVIAIAIGSATIMFLFARHDERKATGKLDGTLRSDAEQRYTQCVARNVQIGKSAEQVREGQHYAVRLFRALRQQDPGLATAIEKIPPPRPQPLPVPVTCIKP